MKQLLTAIICLLLAISFSACNKVDEESKPFQKRGLVDFKGIDLKKDNKTDKNANKKE